MKTGDAVLWRDRTGRRHLGLISEYADHAMVCIEPHPSENDAWRTFGILWLPIDELTVVTDPEGWLALQRLGA